MKKLFVITMLVLTQNAGAEVYKSIGGDVNFIAIGKPGFIKIKGDTAGKFPMGQLKVENGKAVGDFELDLNSLDTHIDLRNEHMKEKYLEVGKYPKARLVLAPIAVQDESLKSDFKSDFTGTLTLKGVTKDIKGTFEYKGQDAAATAQFVIQISDFNIAVPSHLGVVVSDKVEVTSLVKLKK